MTNFPWPMDKPIEEIDGIIASVIRGLPITELYFDYLLTRLKKAESERDGLVDVISDGSRAGAGKYQRVVMEARLYIHNGFKKVTSAFE